MSASSNKHLTLDERRIIERGIYNGSTKTAIAKTLGKDVSTICKEIKEHRQLSHRCAYPVECKNYAKCKPGDSCYAECTEFTPFVCDRRDRSPGACNGCEKWNYCRYTKYRYVAEDAEHEYKFKLVSSREGANLTEEEAKKLAETIKPLVDQGQSPYIILANHPELNISEKTLYTYIEDGVLEKYGVINLDLRRKVGRRIPKKKAQDYKKREDRKYLQGRKMEDYLQYIQENPDASVVQMDTVYNDVTNGPFIQTFKFMKFAFFFAIYHDTKTADDMVQGVIELEKLLGQEFFNKYVNVILTDRGGEFVHPDEMENREDGSVRTRVFYCDPMASRQKGSLENKHIELRYILPNEVNLREIGLTDQTKMNLVSSHLNSYPLERLGGKTPWQVIKFFDSSLAEKFEKYGLSEIEKDAVMLVPQLLK